MTITFMTLCIYKFYMALSNGTRSICIFADQNKAKPKPIILCTNNSAIYNNCCFNKINNIYIYIQRYLNQLCLWIVKEKYIYI